MANIQHWLEQIRRAIYGREVRSSIADAIEAINKEQSHLDGAFNQLIINAGNSNAEVVDARVKADGTQFNTLGERLNKNDEDVLNLSNNFDAISKEVIEARTDKNSVNHGRLKTRLDNIEEQLEGKSDEQENFINTLQRHMQYKNKFSVICNKVAPFPNLSVTYETLEGKGVTYALSSRDDIDQFLTLGLCRYGNLSNAYNISLTKNFDSKTGAWNEVGTYYTTEVGATMTVSFTGGKLVFKHFTDTRGGIWEFVIDGDKDNKVIISTYGTSNNISYTTVFESDENKSHTVVATFKGDDPLNPPSSSPSRGWCGTVAGTTFEVYKALKINTSIVEPLVHASNKEFAFKIKKNGTAGQTYFVPYHGTETAFKITEPKFIINGAEITLNADSVGNMWSGVEDFKVVQNIYARVPNSVENLLKIHCIHTFKNDGTVNIEVKTEALEDTFIESGYGMMFPVWTGFSDTILTGFNNYYETKKVDGSVTYLEKENDSCSNYIALNNTRFKDVFMCVSVNNPKLSLRQNKIDKETRKEYMTWIEHRDNSIQKLYPQVFKDTVFKSGDTYRNSMTFYLGKINDFRDLL